MKKEIIPINEITNFTTRTEEFFPISWYRKMLENQPIYFHKGTNTWNVFKYEHVKQVLSNYQIFSSEGLRTNIFVGSELKQEKIPPILNITNLDPPKHRKYRSLLAAAFTPRSLKEWEPRIRQIATQR